LSYITPEPTITTREAALVVALNNLICAANMRGKGTAYEMLRAARNKALATVAELFPEENKR
jgi:hypothetical protein